MSEKIFKAIADGGDVVSLTKNQYMELMTYGSCLIAGDKRLYNQACKNAYGAGIKSIENMSIKKV